MNLRISFLLLLWLNMILKIALAGMRIVPRVATRIFSSKSLSTPPSAASMGLVKKVAGELTSESKCGINNDAYLLLCVSGGIDSVAMLHLMCQVRRYFMPELELEVIHFNHKQRAESEEEATFVSRLAASYGLGFHLRNYRMNGIKEGVGDGEEQVDEDLVKYSRGFQDTARRWRRKCSEEILQTKETIGGREKVRYIVTGHHQDDQTETLLLKLLRGAHLSNLVQMRSCQGHYLKPLLNINKDELRRFLLDSELEWREDISNTSRDYTRNIVRLDIIPRLQQVAGGASALQKRLDLLSDQSLALNQLLEDSTINFLKNEAASISVMRRSGQIERVDIQRKALSCKPLLEKTEIIHKIVETVAGISLSAGTTNRLLELAIVNNDSEEERMLSLPNGWSGRIIGEVLRIAHERMVDIETDAHANFKTTDTAHGFLVTHSTGSVLRMETGNISSSTSNENAVREKASNKSIATDETIDICINLIQKETPHLCVRAPLPGDRFHPPWRERSVRLVDFLRAKHVPLHLRGDVRVLTAGPRGDILAVGHYVAKGFHRDVTESADGLLKETICEGDREIHRLTVKSVGREDMDGSWLAEHIQGSNSLYIGL